MYEVKTVFRAIGTDKRLILHGFILLFLHLAGVLFIYHIAPEFDNVPHLWFGYVLSEYSSKGAVSINLQKLVIDKLKSHGWTTVTSSKVDYLIRLGGFLLVGGLIWESAELSLSHYFGMRPDSFFAFPITLRNIDGALDVSVGFVGATLAFLIERRAES